MALIVKGNMPRECCECDYRCGINIIAWTMKSSGRHPSCPIIGEIPDEHGRLVSLDKLKESFNQKIFVEGSITVRDITDLLDNAPVVVEASR